MMSDKDKHIHVLDTCVLLHDPHAIYKFHEHDVYIPLAVIDDLDNLKTKSESVGWSAREAFRHIDKFPLNDLLAGVEVNEMGGRLFVYNTAAASSDGSAPDFSRVNSDNELIEVSLALKSLHPHKKVCLVSKDTGLRIRATSWGVYSENYRHDMIDTDVYAGYEIVAIEDRKAFDELFRTKSMDEAELWKWLKSFGSHITELVVNQFVLFQYDKQTCVFMVKPEAVVQCDLKAQPALMGIKPKNLEQKLSYFLLTDNDIPLVSLVGRAGSGKTLMALSAGLAGLDIGEYNKIVVIKPLVPVGGKDIGYLPGDKFAKISAWLGPIKDNLEQLVVKKGSKMRLGDFEEMCEDGLIEVEAMAFIQGRSITSAFIVIDECLAGDSLVYLNNGSTQLISEIQNGQKVTSYDYASRQTKDGTVSQAFTRQSRSMLNVHTYHGVFSCTSTHQVVTVDCSGNFIKKEAGSLTKGDLIPVVDQFMHMAENDMAPDEAYILGLALTDEHVLKNQDALCFDPSEDQEWFQQWCETKFPKASGKYEINCDNKLGNMTCNIEDAKALVQRHQWPRGNKSSGAVPKDIWFAPWESLRFFLQACFDARGTVNTSSKHNTVVSMSTTSKRFAYEIQALLLKFKIQSHVYEYDKSNSQANKTYVVNLINHQACKFGELIGFSLPRKQASLEARCGKHQDCTKVLANTIYSAYTNLPQSSTGLTKSKFRAMMSDMMPGYRAKTITMHAYSRARDILERHNVTISDPILVSRVVKIEPGEDCMVYDFTISEYGNFVFNGMVTSNCQNLSPREARMIVERCGRGSKIVMLGDLSQIENPYLDQSSSGLTHTIHGSKKSRLAASIKLYKVERSELSDEASKIFSKTSGLEATGG